MAKSRKIRRRSEGYRADAGPAPAKREPLVTPEAAAHGDYAEVEFLEEAGKRPVKVMRNRGGTAVERWLARGDVSRAQAEAIAVYVRAYRLRYESSVRTTANWGLVASLRGGSIDFEAFIATQASAKALLEDLDDHVMFAFSLAYYEAWRNVVLHDEAAGVVGSRLGYRNDGAEAAAKSIVLMIADMIAKHLRLG